MKKHGIYKLTAPNGKVYIGQSWDIDRRWSDYRKLNKNSIGRKLYNSLKKYSPDKFIFELELELSSDTQQSTMDICETFYWEYYKDLGFGMLNLRDCDGSRGSHSQETKDKISKANKGIPKSEEHREALRRAKLLKPNKYWKGKSFSKEHKKKLSEVKKGKSTAAKGIKRPYVSERYKEHYRVVIDGIETKYYLSKADLKKMLVISHRILIQILAGRKYKKNNQIIEIYEQNSR